MGIKNFKGFTLIELLVVVAIIGILATVGVVAYNGYTKSAKISVAKTNFKTVTSFMRSENTKCLMDQSLTWMNYAPCSSQTSKSYFYVIFNNWRNCTHLAPKAFPNMKNPYGRIHPYTKTDHAFGCTGAWGEPGEISVHLNNNYLGTGQFGLYIISPAAEFREGTSTKLVCSSNPYFNEKDPNCLREFIPIEF